jgi:hypothetical protein
MRSSRALVLAAVIAGLVLPAATPGVSSAQQNPTLTLTPGEVIAGDDVLAEGSSFPSGSPVRLHLGSVEPDTLLAETVTDRAGSFSVGFTVPPGTLPGFVTVVACVEVRGDCHELTGARLNVLHLPPPPPTTPPVVAPTPTEPPDDPQLVIPPPDPHPEPWPKLAGPPAPPELPPGPSIVGDAPEQWPDLYVRTIEVTQGIQNLRNDMPLVSYRRTYARVEPAIKGEPEQLESWPNVFGVLEGRRDGQVLGIIWPQNGAITAYRGGGVRHLTDHTLNFRLPHQWLDGDVALRAFVFAYAPTTPSEYEVDADNNLLSAEVTFHPSDPLTLHLAPLHLHLQYDPDEEVRTFWPPVSGAGPNFAGQPGEQDFSAIVNGVWRHLPISTLNLIPWDWAVYPPEHGTKEWDIGPCRTPILAAEANTLTLEDWTYLFLNPEEVADGATLKPDHDRLWIRDHRFLVLSVNTATGVATGAYLHEGTVPASDDELPEPGTLAFVQSSCKASPNTSGEPLVTLGFYRSLFTHEGSPGPTYVVGLVHESLPRPWAGLANSGHGAAMSRAWHEASNLYPWYYQGATTFAHEVVHLYGINHVLCKGNEPSGGPVDADHPNHGFYPACSLAPVDPNGYYGFDVYWGMWAPLVNGPSALSNHPSVAHPYRAFPLMGYQLPRWIDPYHYCVLLNHHGVECDPVEIGAFGSTVTPAVPLGGSHGLAGPPAPTTHVSGVIDLAAGTASFGHVFGNPQPDRWAAVRLHAQEFADGDGYELVAEGAGGAELYRTAIVSQDTHGEVDEDHEPDHLRHFMLVVPADPEPYRLRIVSGDTVLAERIASPQLSLRLDLPEPGTTLAEGTRLAWSGESQQDLSYFLQWSPDGERWWPVAGPLTRDGYELDGVITNLPGSSTGQLRVLASDGVRTVHAAAGPYQVANKPPRVAVIGPTSGAIFPVGYEIVLEGTAYDLEDGALAGDALAWESDRDGALGAGRVLEIAALSPGQHVISLTATDADGAVAHAAVEVVVDPAAGTVGTPDPAVMAAIEAVLADSSGLRWVWLPLGLLAGVLGVAALLRYVRRRRDRAPAGSPLREPRVRQV